MDVHQKMSYLIYRLADLSIKSGICNQRDRVYAVNRALEICGMNQINEEYNNLQSDMRYNECDGSTSLEFNMQIHNVLSEILDLSYENGLFDTNNDANRDIFTSRLMDAFISRPSCVENEFYKKYDSSPILATDYFYEFSKNSQYIRMDRVAKNRKWQVDTEYGTLDITINLSKPEKNPRAIAAAATTKSEKYPQCLLCRENEGYAGGLHHPPRSNHRIITLTLDDETWYLQYSPYVYYNEHCIVLKEVHEPMKMGIKTFRRLIDFVEQFPDYFIGSNADLPIVGGSILSHDHFQGGKYKFAMDDAQIVSSFNLDEYPEVAIQVLKWPLSVIRLKSHDKNDIVEVADNIFHKWCEYEDLKLGIIPYSRDVSHNTVTPIARRNGKDYELDIVLRNNRTSLEHPLGIFHPHDDVHNIKKENIGLIEVLGLAVLPARLETELQELAKYWIDEQKCDFPEKVIHHKEWFEQFSSTYKPENLYEARQIINQKTGNTFVRVLEDAGVFKQTAEGKEGFVKFLNKIKNIQRPKSLKM